MASPVRPLYHWCVHDHMTKNYRVHIKVLAVLYQQTILFIQCGDTYITGSVIDALVTAPGAPNLARITQTAHVLVLKLASRPPEV